MSELGFRVSAQLVSDNKYLRKKLERRHRLVCRLIERNGQLRLKITELKRQIEKLCSVQAAGEGEGQENNK